MGMWFTACSGDAMTPQTDTDRPVRIVSLDYCADQYVLKLADREQILAVSPDAVKEFSYMRDEAVGVPTVRSVAEDVLILEPDLIVRSYGGGPNAAAFFERAGIPVLQVGWTSSIDNGKTGSIPSIIEELAAGLDQPDRGEALIASFRQRLDAIKARSVGQTALYMTQGGVTSGPGSLVHEMLRVAGYENFQAKPGWRALPLERLVYQQPDIVAAAFFETLTTGPDAWSAAKHPVAKDLLDGSHVVPLEGAWTACGGWFLMDAIEALAEGRTN